MNKIQKQQISEAIERQIEIGSSARKIANRANVSAATISQMRKGNWQKISQEMWRKVAHAVGHQESGWQLAETDDFRLLMDTLATVQQKGISMGVSHDAGSGKTAASKNYAANTKNVFYLECADYFTRNVFLKKLMQAMGMEPEGYTLAARVEAIIDHLSTLEKPLIILDEADKLRHNVLLFFRVFYNALDGQCGFFLCGTPFFRQNLQKGVEMDRKGYRETYSALGRRLPSLNGASRKDVAAICLVNGIDDQESITKAYNESNGDLRRVRRMVERFQEQTKRKVA